MITHSAVMTIMIEPIVRPIRANALGRDSQPAPMIEAHQETVLVVIRDDRLLACGFTNGFTVASTVGALMVVLVFYGILKESAVEPYAVEASKSILRVASSSSLGEGLGIGWILGVEQNSSVWPIDS
jgi:hypothetical protein